MQIRKLLLGCAALLILLVSCTKNPEKVLPRQDGKWSYEVTTRIYDETSGDLKSEGEGYGSFTFYKDGTYQQHSLQFAGGTFSETFEGTWTLISGDTLVLIYDLGRGSLVTRNAKIVRKKRNLQVWEITTFFLSGINREKIVSIYTLTKD